MKYIEIMTIDEVSKRSRLTISTIRKDVKEGKLKSLSRKGRLLFKYNEVERWLNGTKYSKESLFFV